MEPPAQAPKRILVLTAPYGDGHARAAEAIQEALASVAPRMEAVLVDYFRTFVPDVVTNLSRKAYLDSIKHAPASYGIFYRTIGKVKPDSRVRQMMDSPGRRPLARYLKENPVDGVVSLYPIPSGAAAHLRRKNVLAAPLVTVVTDYTCHPEWLHGGTDAYVVGSESVADSMAGWGVEKDKIFSLGIPIRQAFARAANLAAPVGIANGRRVLVMAGAYGSLGGIRDIAMALEHVPGEVKVTFICGRAAELREKVRDLTRGWNQEPRLLGFVDDVVSEMLAADVVITKAGGITVSEALALGRPVLVYKPIPGQEERNCEFLQDHGAGIALKHRADLAGKLSELLEHPAKLKAMGEAARRAAKPSAATDVAKLVASMAGSEEV